MQPDTINKYYLECKSQWDALPKNVRHQVDLALNLNVTADAAVNAGYALGYSTCLGCVTNMVTYAISLNPDSIELQTIKETLWWLSVRLFMIEYETTLLEKLSEGRTH